MKKKWGVLFMVLGILLISMKVVNAAESITLLEITDTTEVVDSMNGERVLVILEKGNAVFYGGEEKNGWTKIIYQDVEGYVLSEHVAQYGKVEELNKEFEEVINDNKLLFEEVIQVEKEEQQSLIWSVVIVGVIVAIFGVSIVSGIKKNKEEKQYRPIYKGQKKTVSKRLN